MKFPEISEKIDDSQETNVFFHVFARRFSESLDHLHSALTLRILDRFWSLSPQNEATAVHVTNLEELELNWETFI